MKRIIAIIITMVLLCTLLCACGGNTEETTAPTTEAVVTTAVPEMTFASAPSQDQLTAQLDGIIDTKLYNFVIDTDKTSSYTLKKNTAAALSDEITLNGKALPVPYSYENLTQLGFTLEGNKNDILAPCEKFDVIYNYSYAPCTFVNNEGQAISVSLCNTTDKEIAIRDGAMGKNLNLDIATCPDFQVCGIKNGDSVQDAIAKVGNPYEVICSYSEDSGTVNIQYHFQGDKDNTSLWVYAELSGTIRRLSFDCNKDYQ